MSRDGFRGVFSQGQANFDSSVGDPIASRAIAALYGDGPPDQAAEPNASLCRRVGQKLRELGLPEVSNDTILRAANRRRN